MNSKNIFSLLFKPMFVVICILFVSCNENPHYRGCPYENNPKLSSKNGIPFDSILSYTPAKMKGHDYKLKTQMDPFVEKWVSSMLYLMKEPVLYNKYLGKDIYRIFWIGPRPVLFSLVKKGSEYYLITKILNNVVDPEPGKTKIVFWERMELYKYEPVYTYNIENTELPPLKMLMNRTQKISVNEWNTFKQKFDSTGFYYSYPSGNGESYGNELIIEAHLRRRYWFLNTRDSNYEYKWFCNYLLKLSGAGSMVDSLKIE